MFFDFSDSEKLQVKDLKISKLPQSAKEIFADVSWFLIGINR